MVACCCANKLQTCKVARAHSWSSSVVLHGCPCAYLSQALAPATEDQAKELGEEARAHQVGG
jgi:hypothetical protein